MKFNFHKELNYHITNIYQQKLYSNIIQKELYAYHDEQSKPTIGTRRRGGF